MGISVQELPGTRHAGCESGADTSLPPHVRARSYVPYLLFALCAVLYMLPFLRVVWTASDEGSLVEGAVRIVHGQVFARDFFEVMGPGTFYWLAAFFKLFGVTFLAERTCLLLSSLGTLLSMYFLTRRVCGKYQVLPALFLISVYFGTIWPAVNHHVDSNFFGLLSVVCMVLWLDTRRDILLIAAGVLAGITTCILQPKGVLLAVALLAWLWIQQRRRLDLLPSLSRVAGGYFGVIGLTLLYFWRQGALRALIYMNFIWPSQHYGAVNAVPYALGISQFWTHWLLPIHGIQWLTPMAVVLVLPFLLVAALPVLVPILGFGRRKDNLRPDILLYWFCGWALWLSEVHRKDIAHLAAGSSLLIILCVYFLTKYRGKIACVALQLLAISAGALAIVNLFIMLCAHSVPTRVGRVSTFKPDPVLAFLDTHAVPGSDIFAYPYCPMYYFLSGTTNATRYSLLIYNYNTPAQFQDAIHTLDQHKIKYVVWDTRFLAKAATTLFTAAMYRPAGGLLIEPYLESHYRVVKEIDGVRILERKTDENVQRR